MKVSRDMWGRTDAWRRMVKEDPDELAALCALAILDEGGRR